MTTHKRNITLSALGAALILGTAVTTSFAAPPAPGKDHADRMPIRPEAAFVYLLKVADTDKDGKITRQEFAARQDALFAEIDKDKDGNITPKEMREYRQAKMEEFRAAHPRPERENAKADDKRPEERAEREQGGRFGHPGWGRHGGKGTGFALIRMADTDENGQVSKAEFTAAGEKLFERLDRNKDGVISIDDMPDRPFL